MPTIVGYVADADLWCESCAEETYGSEIRTDVVEDSEGNEIRPLFDLDESGDSPDHCGSCGEMIETAWTAEAVRYAEERVQEYLTEGTGNAEILALWIEHAHPWAGFSEDLAEAFEIAEEERAWKSRPRCSQCGEPLSPVSAMMGPVCGDCARRNHAELSR